VAMSSSDAIPVWESECSRAWLCEGLSGAKDRVATPKSLVETLVDWYEVFMTSPVAKLHSGCYR
jgi:hypothetical protein